MRLVGKRIAVYKDPATEKRFEGFAEIIRVITKKCAAEGRVLAIVRFENGDTCDRIVNTIYAGRC